ncbi:neocarzinostatin family protein [Promicromonospora sp. AC04]|uniref:neocarzinostatin apoprotein domain-containing protein n=1 Tax=Promicromonospora sp. AC04 TaxID=2135723 RepID=UPI000D360DA6|nr:neocarzinostatin apoprotein domain-containing protein [Promicromonospora sp. AC04]PUB27187.1 neocarzinostatin family protein [Promicromonospora sp. AC04]
MRARLLAPVAAVVLLLAACTAAPGAPETQETGATSTPEASPTASDGPAGQDDPTITVRATGSAWLVRGTGFSGGNQYLVQCTGGTTAGASALDDCDMSTSEQVVADEDGRISATRQARAFVNVGAVSEVDCTGDPCTLAVADLSDRVLAAAPAPLPGGAEPPDAPTLELSEQQLDGDDGRVTVTGKGYAPGAAVRIVQCATAAGGGVDGDNCLYDDGKRVVADRSGSVVTRLPVKREIQLVGGGAVDCADAGACVIANAWTDGGRMALADLLWE